MGRLLLCGALCLASCGSSSSGAPAGGAGAQSISGTLLGKPFKATDAACTDCGGGINYVTISSGTGSLCGGTAALAGSSLILFNFGTANVGATYSSAPANLVVFDAACNQVAQEQGTGTVTVTGASGSSLSGHFSVTLNAGTVSGDFVAPFCPGPRGCK
jgi:hypothetical protein